MKKIYLSLMAVAVSTAAFSQQQEALSPTKGKFSGVYQLNPNIYEYSAAKSATTAPITDTLNYFLNKKILRSSPTQSNSFSTFGVASSHTAAAGTIMMGGAYENTGTILCFGAQGLVARDAASPSGTVPVVFELYACNASLLPTGVALASLTTAVSNTLGVVIGGQFATPVPVSGNYCIMMGSASTNTLDKVVIFMSDAVDATGAIVADRYGEGMGVRKLLNGNFAKMTGMFSGYPGNDFEGLVGAWVTYTFAANHSQTITTTCNTAPVSYPNTSTFHAGHRQYNLSAFLSKWPQLPNTNAAEYAVYAPIDSVWNWQFGDGSNVVNTINTTHYYGSASTPTTYVSSDNLIVKSMKMSGYSTGVKTFDTKSWTITVNTCNVGLVENNISTQVAIYPNPATDKVTVYVNNANADSQINVLNALGQVVLTRTDLSDKNELNTESLAKGVYFVRVGNGKQTTTTKLVINK